MDSEEMHKHKLIVPQLLVRRVIYKKLSKNVDLLAPENVSVTICYRSAVYIWFHSKLTASDKVPFLKVVIVHEEQWSRQIKSRQSMNFLLLKIAKLPLITVQNS